MVLGLTAGTASVDLVLTAPGRRDRLRFTARAAISSIALPFVSGVTTAVDEPAGSAEMCLYAETCRVVCSGLVGEVLEALAPPADSEARSAAPSSGLHNFP